MRSGGHRPSFASLRVTRRPRPAASAGLTHSFTCSIGPHHQILPLEHPDGCATARPLGDLEPREPSAEGPARAPPAASALPVGTIAFLTALYGVLYLVWEQSHWGSEAVRDLVGNVAFMPLNLGVLVLFVLASRNEVLDPRVRRALRLYGIGSGMVFIGNAISAWYVLARHENPPVSWADPFYLSDSLLTLTALLLFPLARRTRLERWKFVLDAAMVLVGGGVAIWYFSVRPTAASQESTVVVTLLAFAYPLVSMLVLLGVTTRAAPPADRRQPAGIRPAADRHRRSAWSRTSRSTWCSSRRAGGARAGPTASSWSATCC